MTRLSLCAAGLALLAACASSPAAPTDPDFVPILQLLEEMRATPYECVGYDPATRSCEATGRMRLVGEMLVSEDTFLFSAQPRLSARGTTRYEPVNGLACSDPAQIEMDFLEVDSPELERQVEAMFREGMRGAGKVCIGYFRTGPRQYRVEARDQSGRRLNDSEIAVRFMARPGRLRQARL
jgi:hypothetical protein